MKPPNEFWHLLGIAVLFFAVLAGIAMIASTGAFS